MSLIWRNTHTCRVILRSLWCHQISRSILLFLKVGELLLGAHSVDIWCRWLGASAIILGAWLLSPLVRQYLAMWWDYLSRRLLLLVRATLTGSSFPLALISIIELILIRIYFAIWTKRSLIGFGTSNSAIIHLISCKVIQDSLLRSSSRSHTLSLGILLLITVLALLASGFNAWVSVRIPGDIGVADWYALLILLGCTWVLTLALKIELSFNLGRLLLTFLAILTTVVPLMIWGTNLDASLVVTDI